MLTSSLHANTYMYTCVPIILVYIHIKTGTYKTHTHNFIYKEQQVHPGKGFLGMYQNSFICLVNTAPPPLGVRSHSPDKRNKYLGKNLPDRRKTGL